jgi:hypothetical protein
MHAVAQCGTSSLRHASNRYRKIAGLPQSDGSNCLSISCPGLSAQSGNGGMSRPQASAASRQVLDMLSPSNFVLTNFNAGIVSEIGHHGRSYQVMTRPAQGQYVDPDAWLAAAPRKDGSWWPE